MATTFPTTLQDLDATRGTATQRLSSPSHVTHHALEDDTIEALQAKVGIDNSAVVTSLDYLLKSTSSSNPGHKHTLANGATDVTASVTELNYVDGVTSAIQTQLNAKAPSASPTFTGIVTLPKTTEIQDTSADHQYVLAVSELTADRTITLPLLTSNDTFVFRNHDNIAIKFNTPDGFLINGRIVPSVATNDLTVAIKGMDGNDPSASNPVYVRIGNTVRSITAATSVASAAGANRLNAGSSELATKEIDYFVYAIYQTTDAVVKIGFARRPDGRLYSDFSSTSTNENYFYFTGTLSATDEMVVIGRFAATMSAGAGYTWSVPTFTNKNLIQRPIYETRWIDWEPTIAGSGTMTYTSVSYGLAKYKIVYDTIYIRLQGVTGTTGGTATDYLTFTTPFLGSPNTTDRNSGACQTFDADYSGGSVSYISGGTFRVKKYDSSTWALAAGKGFYVSHFYGI